MSNYKCKLTDEQRKEIARSRKTGGQLAREYGVSRETVRNCRKAHPHLVPQEILDNPRAWKTWSTNIPEDEQTYEVIELTLAELKQMMREGRI